VNGRPPTTLTQNRPGYGRGNGRPHCFRLDDGRFLAVVAVGGHGRLQPVQLIIDEGLGISSAVDQGVYPGHIPDRIVKEDHATAGAQGNRWLQDAPSLRRARKVVRRGRRPISYTMKK
jgi:hypothetical protein